MLWSQKKKKLDTSPYGTPIHNPCAPVRVSLAILYTIMVRSIYNTSNININNILPCSLTFELVRLTSWTLIFPLWAVDLDAFLHCSPPRGYRSYWAWYLQDKGIGRKREIKRESSLHPTAWPSPSAYSIWSLSTLGTSQPAICQCLMCSEPPSSSPSFASLPSDLSSPECPLLFLNPGESSCLIQIAQTSHC